MILGVDNMKTKFIQSEFTLGLKAYIKKSKIKEFFQDPDRPKERTKIRVSDQWVILNEPIESIAKKMGATVDE